MLSRTGFLFLAVGLGASSLPAAITIQVFPASAPNVFSSPSFNTWRDNAINALYSGATFAGSSGPSFYSQYANNSTLPTALNIASSFPSWQGRANPGTVFGAAYANESGNRLDFGVVIRRGATDAQFSISQLAFDLASNNADIAFSFGIGSYTYSANFVGILYGPDGAFGGGDDVFVTGGANTQLVDALVSRGSGSAYAADGSTPGANDQERLDSAALSSGSYFLNGTYTLNGNSGGATIFFVAPVPEPGTYALLSSASVVIAGLALRKRRRTS